MELFRIPTAEANVTDADIMTKAIGPDIFSSLTLALTPRPCFSNPSGKIV